MIFSDSSFPSNKTFSEFEFLAILARNDPSEFEEVRKNIIDEFIQAQVGERKVSLLRLQWRIDQTRRQATNPMHALVKLNAMMWSSLANLAEIHHKLLTNDLNLEIPAGKVCEVVDLSEYKKSRTKF